MTVTGYTYNPGEEGGRREEGEREREGEGGKERERHTCNHISLFFAGFCVAWSTPGSTKSPPTKTSTLICNCSTFTGELLIGVLMFVCWCESE